MDTGFGSKIQKNKYDSGVSAVSLGFSQCRSGISSHDDEEHYRKKEEWKIMRRSLGNYYICGTGN